MLSLVIPLLGQNYSLHSSGIILKKENLRHRDLMEELEKQQFPQFLNRKDIEVKTYSELSLKAGRQSELNQQGIVIYKEDGKPQKKGVGLKVSVIPNFISDTQIEIDYFFEKTKVEQWIKVERDDFLTPIFSKRELKSTITIDVAKPVVLGGLLSDNETYFHIIELKIEVAEPAAGCDIE